MHKSIRLQLPDLRILTIRADFSVSAFASVCKLCKDLGKRITLLLDFDMFSSLGIRHAEELSLVRSPKISNTIDRRTSPRRRRQNLGTLNRYNPPGDSLANNTSTLIPPTTLKLRSTMAIDKITDSSLQQQHSISKSLNCLTINDQNLARTPLTPTKNLLLQLNRPGNLIEKCKLNNLWLDSSKSLMAQHIHENDLILLRFKYYSFYDLNPKVKPTVLFFILILIDYRSTLYD
jgi:kindlin 2